MSQKKSKCLIFESHTIQKSCISLFQKPYFKSPVKLSCFGLNFNSKESNFQNTSTFGTGLPGFHKLTTTVLKLQFSKQKPRVIFYGNCITFCNEHVRAELDCKLSKQR